MLITVAIPTYNNEKTIAKAIESALYQKDPGEYEVLIVNNASTDNTQSIIDQFNNNLIRVVINERTCDMYANHNVCLKEARGEYILFCHSDDELLPDTISIVRKRIEFRNKPSRYIMWGHSLFRDFNSSIIRGKQQINTMFSGEAALCCFLGGGLTPSGTIYSRLSLLEIGGFPLSNSKAPAMDWAVLVIAACNCFEFEMIDRLVFKRTAASTAVKELSEKDKISINKDAFKVMFSKISNNHKSFFINQLMVKPSLTKLKSLREFIPRSKYRKELFKQKLINLFA